MPERRRMVSKQLATFSETDQWLKGTVVVKEEQTVNERTIGRYEIHNPEGMWILNGTQQIDEAFVNLEVGAMVEIHYLGEAITSNGFKVKRFEIYEISLEDENGEE